MDLIASVEPQVALPVVGAVLCAFLVYIFGFQKSQEPSFQHLAVLSEKKPKPRQPATQIPSQKAKGTVQQQVAKAKPLANGHAVTEKTPKSPKVLQKENKENVKPKKNVKDPKEKPEDFEGGEWIQAFSRKEKNAKREKKQKKEEIFKGKEEVAEKVEKVEKIEVVLERMRAESPKKEAVVAPKVEVKEVEKVEKKVEKKPAEKKQTEKKKEEPPKKSVEEKVEEKVVTPPMVEETKTTNVAFDELGDSWEEAKSRGTKKRRARKD